MSDEIKVHVVRKSKRGTVTWYARYRDPVTGKDVVKSTGSAKKKDALRFAAVWQADLKEGRYKPSSRIEWSEFRDRFENEKLRDASDKYAGVFSTAFNQFEAITGIVRLADAPKLVRLFEQGLRDAKKKPTTVKTYLKHLRVALYWAHKHGYLPEKPLVELPKVEETMKGRPVTEDEYKLMLKAAKDQPTMADYITGLWLSGLRREESMRLSWDEADDFTIDMSGLYPRFKIQGRAQKSRKAQFAPMTPDFAEWLLGRTPTAARWGRVFNPTGPNGIRLEPDAVGRRVSDIARDAGLTATAHDLRRSFGTRWASQVMPAVLRELMRHASIETTMKFYVGQEADEIAAQLWQRSLQVNP